MNARSVIVIIVMSVVASVPDLRTRAAEPVPPLDDLLKEYQVLGLPLPPKDAKLVRYESGGGGIVNGVVQPKTYDIAFEVKPGTKTEPPTILTGTMQWQPSWNPTTKEVSPDPAGVKDFKFYSYYALPLAIQCHARGWDQLANHLLEVCKKEEKFDARKQLTEGAWHYWEGHLTEPKADRAPVAKRLKEVLQKDKSLDNEYRRALLKSLDLALAPSKAKPGSVEELIDDLVDYTANTGTLGVFEPEERYFRIAKLGFDAVPALIEHLNDDRLTRAMMRGFNNFPSWHLRVGNVVGDLLEGLAGEPLMRGTDTEDVGADWLRRQQGYSIKVNAAKKWWEKARKVGEEAYLLDHVLPPKSEQKEQAWANQQQLHLIQSKYPKHLPSLYRTVLDKRPDIYSHPLAEALVASKLPPEEKLPLFLHAAKNKETEHRIPALSAIKNLDKKKFNSLLIETIEGFPKDVETTYWSCPEANLVHLVPECDDPRIWPALEAVIKRSSLGLRMEILHSLAGFEKTKYRTERLRILASYLNDDALRDEKADHRFEGPGAGFPYGKITVQDFVAIEIGRFVGIKVETKLDRTPAEWAKIREQVREALKRELDKPSK
jgi:hypothetical protein